MEKINNPNPYVLLRINEENENSIFASSDINEIRKIHGLIDSPFYVGREILIEGKKYTIKNVQVSLLNYLMDYSIGISFDNSIGKEIPYLSQIDIIVE